MSTKSLTPGSLSALTTRTVDTIIAAPPLTVWEVLADLPRMSEWSPEVQSVTWLDGVTTPAVGARFRGRNQRARQWTTTCTVTAAEPGRTLAFRVGRGATTWRYDLVPEGDGTRITETVEIVRAPGPVGRWLTAVGTGVRWNDRLDDLASGMQTTLERLNAAVEAHR